MPEYGTSLGADAEYDAGLFLQVNSGDRGVPQSVVDRDAQYIPHLTDEQNARVLLSMLRAQGLAAVPEEAAHLLAGMRVQVIMHDWTERE